MSTSAPPWALCVDFDGTAVDTDLGDALSIELGGREAWERAERDYAAGAIPFRELLRRIFAGVTADAQAIAAWARGKARFRRGFAELVTRCAAARMPVVLVSAGLDVYIEPALALLPEAVRAHLVVRSNHGLPSAAGLEVRFREQAEGCGSCGACKRVPVEALRAEGRRVAFVGDGVSDRCGAAAADLVFARGSLRALAERGGWRWQEWRDFDEVAARLFAEAGGAGGG